MLPVTTSSDRQAVLTVRRKDKHMNIIQACEDFSTHVLQFWRDIFANVWLWIEEIPTTYAPAVSFFTAVFCLILGAECVGLIIWAIKRKFG